MTARHNTIDPPSLLEMLSDGRIDILESIVYRENLATFSLSLSDAEYTAVRLRALGYSYDEIAAETGTECKQVDNCLQRANRKLNAAMKAA